MENYEIETLAAIRRYGPRLADLTEPQLHRLFSLYSAREFCAGWVSLPLFEPVRAEQSVAEFVAWATESPLEEVLAESRDARGD